MGGLRATVGPWATVVQPSVPWLQFLGRECLGLGTKRLRCSLLSTGSTVLVVQERIGHGTVSTSILFSRHSRPSRRSQDVCVNTSECMHCAAVRACLCAWRMCVYTHTRVCAHACADTRSHVGVNIFGLAHTTGPCTRCNIDRPNASAHEQQC